MAFANGLVAIGFVTIVFVVAVVGIVVAAGAVFDFGSILEVNVVAVIVPLLFSLQMDTISLDFGLSLFLCTGIIVFVSG